MTENGTETPARPDHSDRQLVMEHVGLIDRIVGSFIMRFPRHVDRDDLWSAGAEGLVEAARRFDPSRGVPFQRYATIRIKGAILDGTRTRDWVPRSLRRRMREMHWAAATLAGATGRQPTEAELADALDATEDEIAALRAESAQAAVLHIDLTVADDVADDSDAGERDRPDVAVDRAELTGALREAVELLPGVHGEVVARHYLDGDAITAIAADLGVTVARVSQIRSEGVLALRTHFGSLYEGVPEVPADAPGIRLRAAFAAEAAARSSVRSRLAARPPE